MARSTFLKVPLPRRKSVSASKPSTEMAGTKFLTRSISSAKASSMSVPLVKEENSQSGCASHRRRTSALRTSGSPPVNRYMCTPSAMPWRTMSSISS